MALPAPHHHNDPLYPCRPNRHRGNFPISDNFSSEEDDEIVSLSGQFHNHHEYKLKMDILTFDGRLDIEEVLDWVQTNKACFEYMEIQDSKLVKYVAYKLKARVAT